MSIFDLMALPWRLRGAMAGYAAGAQRHACRSCGYTGSPPWRLGTHSGEAVCPRCWQMLMEVANYPRCTRCGHPGAAYSESGPVLCGTCQGERYQEAEQLAREMDRCIADYEALRDDIERVAAACPRCSDLEAPAPAITDGQLRAALLRDLDPAATVQIRDADGSWIDGDSRS